MKFSYIVALLIAVLLGGTYWYNANAHQCPIPLAYRIGFIDESFDLSKEEALVQVTAAEKLWEDMADRELFVYDDSAEFTVDFVFDERQAGINAEEQKLSLLDNERKRNQKILETVESLQGEYETLFATYTQRDAQYEQELSEYNAQVQKYNDRGGAPKEVFAELEITKERLQTEAGQLQKMAVDLRSLATNIEELSARGNRLIKEYNQDVQAYNEEFGFVREFTQGDYQGDKIHIYTFSSNNELVTVLAHEFGHALGIDHVDDSTAVMYYLMEDTDQQPFLSEADKTAYQTVCGTEESVSQKVRRIIRETLARI